MLLIILYGNKESIFWNRYNTMYYIIPLRTPKQNIISRFDVEIICEYDIMKRTYSFIHGFQKIDIQVTTNVDDSIMKSLTPPSPSFLLDFLAEKPQLKTTNLKIQPTICLQ